jgi:hypothetical protein
MRLFHDESEAPAEIEVNTSQRIHDDRLGLSVLDVERADLSEPALVQLGVAVGVLEDGDSALSFL